MAQPSPTSFPSPLITGGNAFGRANNFDAMRLFFALAVVWSHSFALYYGSESRELVSLVMHGTYNSGNVAVLGFFAISGFLIAHSFERSSSPGSFLSKRVRRIHPGFIVATMICCFAVTPLWSKEGFGAITARTAAKSIGLNVLLQGYVPPASTFPGNHLHAVNGALWSIPFEFWCYLGTAALGLCGLLRRRWLVGAIVVALILTRAWLDATGRRPGGGAIGKIIGFPYFWFMVLPPFLCGTFVYLSRATLSRSRWTLAAALAMPVLASHLPIEQRYRAICTNVVFSPCLAYAIFHVAFSRTAKAHHFGRFGDFSYGTYLYAFPIQQILFAEFGERLPFAAYLTGSLVLSVLAGAISWFAVERWFIRAKQHAGPAPAKGPPPEAAAPSVLVAP